MFRQLACLGLVVSALAAVSTPIYSDSYKPASTIEPGTIDNPPPEDDPCAQDKWLTWSPTDCQGNAIDLTTYQNKKVFVIVFTPSNEDSCNIMRKAAKYCRDHENAAGKILAFCSDDTGCDAVKLFIRQEEWTKRVKAWNEAQEVAKAAAEAEGKTFEAKPVPDYLKAIEDEMKTAEGLTALNNHHLPFKTATHCKGMWNWLKQRMTAPAAAPRVLKFNAQGSLLNEWSDPPENPNPLAAE